MNRKNFLSSIIPVIAAPAAIPNILPAKNIAATESIVPPYVKAGELIGITSPAGFITLEDIQPAVAKLKEWGYEVSIGNTIGKRDFTFGGTDEERKSDLQQMLDNPAIKAIMCARGGYGAVRIVDQLDFTTFAKKPKWIIGFSDITVLHSHINRHFGIASLHSKMCNSFPANWSLAEPVQIETINSIRQCLAGENMSYPFAGNPNNKAGKASGILIGGNLKTLESLAGSSSDLVTKNKLLFVEDTGEYLYSIDRMFWNLKRTGKLDHLKGLIVGGFKIKKEETEAEAFGKTLEQIVLEKVKDCDYPVCFDFPVGHQKNNYALKCGVKHELEVGNEGGKLREI